MRPSPDESGRGKRLIIASRSGRLANRLIIFANFVGFAAEHGHRVVNCTFHSYAHLFSAPASDIYCRFPLPRRKSVFDRVPGLSALIRDTRIFYRLFGGASRLTEMLPRFSSPVKTLREPKGNAVIDLEGAEMTRQIQKATTIFFHGWCFRAPACMRRHADTVRSYFRPVARHERKSAQMVKALRAQAEVVVGVHIRHGDYRAWRKGKYYYPASRYAAWMQEITEQLGGRRVAFLVCSDEPRNAQEFPGLTVGLSDALPVEDLYALAGCDYIVGPMSTFSQWASFVGNRPLFHLGSAEDRVDLERFRVSYLDNIPGQAPAELPPRSEELRSE